PTPSLISSKPAWELEGSNGSKMPGKSRSSVLENLGSGGPIQRIQQKANLHPTPSLKSSQPAWELERSNGCKMAGKHKRSVIDYPGSGGPMRRTRQKANLLSTPSIQACKRKRSVLDDPGSGGPMCRSRQKANPYSQGRTNEEQRNTGPKGWNLANISAAEISDLETMLKQKTFTRYEIERLTRLGEGDKANISNDSHPTPSLKSSQPAWELERSNGCKMACKRKRSVLDDPGYGGPMCRSRQKANPYSQGSSLSKHKSEFDLSAQRLLLSSEPKQKASKAIVENGETRMHNSGYKSESHHHIEENGPQQFAVPLNVPSSMNGNSTAPVQGNAPTTNAASTLALPAEPPQKKPAFRMSAPEDLEVLDDDNHIPLLEGSTSFLTGHGEEFSTLWIEYSTPIPFPPVFEKMSLTDANYGSVRRFYIESPEDNAIPITLQQSMISESPPEKVFCLKGSDHSLFFSKPQALHKLLVEIAKIT
nr:hypothetical protein [Tanacetum cinerariifolium]